MATLEIVGSGTLDQRKLSEKQDTDTNNLSNNQIAMYPSNVTEHKNYLIFRAVDPLSGGMMNKNGLTKNRKKALFQNDKTREFVSSLATRIIELSENGVTDFSGSYDDYLRSQGVLV